MRKVIRNITKEDLSFWCEVNYNFEEKYEAYKELRPKVEKIMEIANEIANVGLLYVETPVYDKDRIRITISVKKVNKKIEHILIVRYLNKNITKIEMDENFKLKSYVSLKNNIKIGKNLLSDFLDLTINILNNKLIESNKIYAKLSEIKINKDDLNLITV